MIWLSVLFTAVYGGDIVTSGGDRIPSSIAVALFALFATTGVARYGFGRGERR